MNDNKTGIVRTPIDYRAKDVSWKDVKKAQLHVTNKSLQLVTKKLWVKQVVTWELQIPSITAVHLNADANEIVVESQLGNAAISDRLVLTHSSDVRQAFEKINSLFESCRDQRDRERRDREEAERKTRDEAERKKQQAFQAYHALISSVGGQLWQVTQGLYRIIMDIRIEDWEKASSSFQAARDELAGIVTKVDVAEMPLFGTLDKALAAREGEQVVTECAETLGRLVEFLDTAKPKIPGWEWGDTNDVITPSWRHLPYLVLFCATYNETLLDYDTANKDGTRVEIDRLERVTRIVNPLFSVDLNEYIKQLRQAVETGNSDLLRRNNDQLDLYISGFFSRQQATNPMEPRLAKE
ncbi:MAG: hypothetical protein Q8P44_06965 [Dehalococcoidia bacterium]|nr:hypothetical protein [Dehalococcoidia bacterium]